MSDILWMVFTTILKNDVIIHLQQIYSIEADYFKDKEWIFIVIMTAVQQNSNLHLKSSNQSPKVSFSASSLKPKVFDIGRYHHH